MPWTLMRQDDTGHQYTMQEFDTAEEARAALAEYEARGHKQMYWLVGQVEEPGSQSLC